MENQEQDQGLQAAVEAIVYVADEPVTVEQISAALGDVSHESVREALRRRDFVRASQLGRIYQLTPIAV